MRECWNWQTGKTKDLVVVWSCGFKSHLPHYCFYRKRLIIENRPLFLLFWKLIISHTKKAVELSISAVMEGGNQQTAVRHIHPFLFLCSSTFKYPIFKSLFFKSSPRYTVIPSMRSVHVVLLGSADSQQMKRIPPGFRTRLISLKAASGTGQK